MGTKILSTVTAAALTAMLVAPVGAQTEHVTPLRNTGTNIDGASTQFAQELFGPNSGSVKLALASVIRINYGASSGVTVDEGQSAVFTFRFTGARLAEPVSAGDLSYTDSGDFVFSQGRDGGGGQRGDDFVSYTVTAPEGGGTVALQGKGFTFAVPDVEMVSVADGETPRDRMVIVTVTIEPPAQDRFSTGGSNFPKYPATSTATDTPDVNAEDEQPGPRNAVAIARIVPAYTLAVDPSATSETAHMGQIDLDDPTMLTATSSTAQLIKIGGLGANATSGIKLSSVTIEDTAGDQKAADGSTNFSAGTTDMLRVAVSGNFSSSDRLFLSATTTGDVTYNESNDLLLTISADGTTAEGAGPLAGTGAIVAGSQRALYYVPGGGRIGRGDIGVRYTLDFAAATARDSMMAGKPLTLEYSGINFTTYAYGIPDPSNQDSGNLRIRCEGASTCTVFFRCMDQRGGRVGGFVRTTIQGESVQRYSSGDIATMLGVDGWMVNLGDRVGGRLSCSLHSSSRVSVQLLVRSGGVLTNNTFIGGLGASQ